MVCKYGNVHYLYYKNDEYRKFENVLKIQGWRRFHLEPVTTNINLIKIMKFGKKERRFWKTKFSFGLKNIPEKIQHLSFRDDYLNNEELCFITSRVRRIDRLDLDSTSVDDDGVPFLLEMEYIGELRLVNLCITDKAIDSLVQLESLRFLHLGSTKVSCDGILKLAQLNNLNKLLASPDRVEKDKLNDFLKLKPECELTINSKPYSKIDYNF